MRLKLLKFAEIKLLEETRRIDKIHILGWNKGGIIDITSLAVDGVAFGFQTLVIGLAFEFGGRGSGGGRGVGERRSEKIHFTSLLLAVSPKIEVFFIIDHMGDDSFVFDNIGHVDIHFFAFEKVFHFVGIPSHSTQSGPTGFDGLGEFFGFTHALANSLSIRRNRRGFGFEVVADAAQENDK
ncbi:MAG: hypothetical protein UX82_C0007G0003 [Microgenomates group bacterium GW2011_GWE1_47_12]|nr:MAG: hypothetical protein UX32_C0006G0010 [Microgenomates group bacterium GW2011_GWF1_46_12]KKU44951.1 MAG: hypothetical protein UX63_C0016G0017 [Microgenomates group bacterium GW2011_GWB1_46_7]KKU60806.1 MAG: hypothetical protein UX82_C0007G0003 [Microgenomates group bacterium GW2011_GWE1_47_12]KKU62783.1 MAG: hypothetical protein UX84_C0002G0044 [Microgenomates group bacterium GW2011_GWD1_47_13]